MARVAANDVKGILLEDYDIINQPNLIPFITAASLLVDRVVACAIKKSKPLSSDEAFQLELWLAAHLYCQSDQPYSSKSTAGASGSFQGQTGMGLDNTKYGQTAKLLDPSGCLVAIVSGATEPKMDWIDVR